MIPRPEYPRPQFVRDHWLCLNGEWQFEADPGDSGRERGLVERTLAGRILVPFCPESPLSGVGDTDFHPTVWYRRDVRVPSEWAGQRILLHFQAVDYDATVWAIPSSNGSEAVEVGRHRGGFSPFTCDLSGIAVAGEDVTLVVRARDDHRPAQPRGKQSQKYGSHGCHYTRTTGIWQTVWMEPVPRVYLKRPRITPDVAGSAFHLELPLSGNRRGYRLRATLTDADGTVTVAETDAGCDLAPRLNLEVPPQRRRLWSPEDPFLYGLTVELLDGSGATVDCAECYAGLRSVAIDGKAVRINDRCIFQRLVLDQGYYPDGIMTAPTDAALEDDIRLSMEAGFNGARLHQKVFEERFLYHADRLGYLVWGEFGDWGCAGYGPGGDHQQPGATYITQWLEVLERDYSHPSIVGWCPLNETAQEITDRVGALDDVTRGMYLATKAMDATRPVLDTSGYSHRVAESDIWDCHDYEQDPDRFEVNHAGLAKGQPYVNGPKERPWSLPYRGQPFFVSEFGGIWWNPDVKPGEASWGYGNRPESLDEFYTRLEGLCDALLSHPEMFGYCYTQLTDVEQEQNGVYTYDRRVKFDAARLRAIQQRPAAIELRDGADIVASGKDL